MAVNRYTGDRFTGLSSDTKPTNVTDGSTFHELDTNFLYQYYTGQWHSIGSKWDYLNGSPTDFISYEDFLNTAVSSGVTSGCDITDNGDGTVDISSGHALIRSGVDDRESDLYSITVSAQTGITFTDNSINYIYIDWNAGSPQFNVTTSDSGFNCIDKCLAYVVHREGTVLDILDAREQNIDADARLRSRLFETKKFTRAGNGSIIGYTDRYISLTAGKFYFMLIPIEHLVFDTSVAGTNVQNVFEAYYRDGVGGWNTLSDQKQIDNAQYDDGSGTLAPLSNNDWAVHWVYLVLDNVPTLEVVYSQESYNSLSRALDATPPAVVPDRLNEMAAFVGRVIIQEGSTTIHSVESAFGESFGFSSVTDHNDLTGLQGGALNEYYHLDGTDYTRATAFLDGGSLTHTGIETSLNNKLEDITNESIGDLQDVLIATPSVDDVLFYDAGGDWVNRAITEADISNLGPYDNYVSWDLAVDGTSQGGITSGEQVNFVGGTNVTLNYSATNNTITINAPDTTLSEEEVQDFAWNVLTGTQTLINVTYDDINNNVDFVVDNDLSNYDNSTSGFLTSVDFSDINGTAYITSLETFSDVDTQLMTAAAIDDLIESKGYITSETDNQTLSWNGSSGELTISNGNTVDIDGRYALDGHTHDTSDVITGTFNVNRLDRSYGYYQIDPDIPLNQGAYASLTTPTMSMAAIVPQAVENKMQFAVPSAVEYSTDNGSTWTSIGVSQADLKSLVQGTGTSGGFSITDQSWTNIRMVWDHVDYPHGYVYLNYLHLYTSVKSNDMSITIEAKDFDTQNWSQITSTGTFAGWPTHVWVPHTAIPYTASSGRNDSVRVIYDLIWDTGSSNEIDFIKLNWFGSYQVAAHDKVTTWDVNGNFIVQNNLEVTGTATVGGNSVLDSSDLLSNGGTILTTANEGSGNGIDADQLDGQEGAYYLDFNNFTNVPTYDNYVDWDLAVDGTKQLDVTSGTQVNFAAGTNVTLGYNAGTITINAPDTTLTEEEVQDFAWNVLTGSQTLINVTYDDINNNVDFIVNDDLSLYDNTTSGFLTDVAFTDIQAGSVLTSAEAFADVDDQIMTAAAIDDLILSKGYTTNTGDITAVTAGVGLAGGGTSGSVSLSVDLSELTDMTATMVGTDEFIVLDAGADRRKAANEINLSIFNDDLVYDNYVGWGLQANGGSFTTIQASEVVNFTGSGATSVSRSGNTITISSTDTGDPNQNAFANISDGTNTASADSTTDTLTLTSANTLLSIVASDTTPDDTVTFTVENDLSQYDNSTSGFLTDVAFSDIQAGSVLTSAEAFSDVDTQLMTAAAIDDLILNKGYTSNTGDITSVGAGTGLSGGGASGAVTLSVDLFQMSDMTAAMAGTDEFIVLDTSDGNTTKRKAASEIPLSIFNDDITYQGWNLWVDGINEATINSTEEVNFAAGTNVTLSYSATNNTVTIDATAAGEANQNAFATIAVSGETNVVADSPSDTVTFAAGGILDITTDAGTDTVTFDASISTDSTITGDGTAGSPLGVNEANTFTWTANHQFNDSVGIFASPLAGTPLRVDAENDGGFIQQWYTQDGLRPLQLIAPLNANTNDPFRWTTSNAVAWEIDGVVEMTLSSNGELGVGTETPNSKFHVHDTQANDPYILISSDVGTIARVGDTGTGNDGMVQLFDDAASETIRIRGGSGNSFFNTGGNFGFGTSSPITDVEVESTDATTYSETTASRNLFRISNSSQTDNSYAAIDFAVRNTAGNFGNAHISAISVAGEASADLAFQVRDNGTSQEALRIYSNQDVEAKEDVSAKSYTGKDSTDTKQFEMVYNENTESVDFNFL